MTGPGDFVVFVEPDILQNFIGDESENAIGLIEWNQNLFITNHVRAAFSSRPVYFNDTISRQQACFVSNAKIELQSVMVSRSVCTGDSCMGTDQVRYSDVGYGNCACFCRTCLVTSNITFILRLKITLQNGKPIIASAHTSRLDTARFFKWPTGVVKKVDDLLRIHRDITPSSFTNPIKAIRLRRGIQEVLTYVNNGNQSGDKLIGEDNSNGGFDMTLWIRRAQTQDKAANNNNQTQGSQNNQQMQQQTVAAGAVKHHISYMVPSCTDATFLKNLESLKLDNDLFLDENVAKIS